MIANAKWFNRRKYTGWGLMPKTWQGWVYVLIGVGIIMLIQSLPLDPNIKFYLYIIVGGIFLADVLHVMANMKLDEREAKIEAIAERNASWVMVGTIALSTLYVAEINPTLSGPDLIPYFIMPLVTGVIVKAASNFILERRGL